MLIHNSLDTKISHQMTHKKLHKPGFTPPEPRLEKPQTTQKIKQQTAT